MTRGEQIAAVQYVVPEKFVQASVKFVGAAARDHIDHTARGLPELSRIVVALYLELFYRVRRGRDIVSGARSIAALIVVVVYAVQPVELVLRGLPADTGPPRGLDRDTRRQRDQLINISTIQREGNDLLGIDDLAEEESEVCSGGAVAVTSTIFDSAPTCNVILMSSFCWTCNSRFRRISV